MGWNDHTEMGQVCNACDDELDSEKLRGECLRCGYPMCADCFEDYDGVCCMAEALAKD